MIYWKYNPFGVGSKAGIKSHLLAAYWGFKDGFAQPYELSTSKNIEHLPDWDWDLLEFHCVWMNIGQFVRSPKRHQRLD